MAPWTFANSARIGKYWETVRPAPPYFSGIMRPNAPMARSAGITAPGSRSSLSILSANGARLQMDPYSRVRNC